MEGMEHGIGRFDLLRAGLDELWAIHDCVRQHDKLGREWDKDFNARVMAAILEAQAHPDRTGTLLCYEEELWQIDRQVPGGLMVGTQATGRNLLTKVMQLLVKLQGGEGDGEAEDTAAGADARADARADAGEAPGGGAP